MGLSEIQGFLKEVKRLVGEYRLDAEGDSQIQMTENWVNDVRSKELKEYFRVRELMPKSMWKKYEQMGDCHDMQEMRAMRAVIKKLKERFRQRPKTIIKIVRKTDDKKRDS